MDEKPVEKLNENNCSKLSDLNLDNKETRVLNEDESMQLHVESDEPLKVGQVIKGPDGPLIILKMEGSDELYAVPCNENGAIAIGESALIQNGPEPTSELQNNLDTLLYYDFNEKFSDQMLSTASYNNDIFNDLYNCNTHNISDPIELPQTNQNNYLPNSYLNNDFIAEQNHTNLPLILDNNNNLNNVKQDILENVFDKYQYFDSTSKIDDILNVPITKTEDTQFNYDFEIENSVGDCFENSNQLIKLKLPKTQHVYNDTDKDPCPVYLDFDFDNVCQEPTTLHTQLQEQLQKPIIENKLLNKKIDNTNENIEVLNTNDKIDILNTVLKENKLSELNVTCTNINNDHQLKNNDILSYSNNDVSYINSNKNENVNGSKDSDIPNLNYDTKNDPLIENNFLIKQPQNCKMKLSEYAQYTNQIATASEIYSPNASPKANNGVKIVISNYEESNVIKEIKIENDTQEKDNVSHITLSQLIEPIYRPPLKTKKCIRKQYKTTELEYNNENSLEKEFEVIDKQTVDIPLLIPSNCRRGRKQTLETINVSDMDLIFTCELAKSISNINTENLKKKLNTFEKDDIYGGSVKRGRPKKQTSIVCEQAKKKSDQIDIKKFDENLLKRKCDNDCDTIVVKEVYSNINNKNECVSKRSLNKKLKHKDVFDQSDSSDTDSSYGRFESFPDELTGQKLTLKCNICLKLFKTSRSLFIHQKRCNGTDLINENEPKLDEQLGTFTLDYNNIVNAIDYDKDIEEIEYLDEYFDTTDTNIVNKRNIVITNNDKKEDNKTVIKNKFKLPEIILTTPNNDVKTIVSINNNNDNNNNNNNNINNSNDSKKHKNKINNNINNSFNQKNNNIITSPKVINKINTRSSTSSLSTTGTIINSDTHTINTNITKKTSNDIIKNNILNPNINKCNTCNKIFRQKNHLNAHKRTHDLVLKCKYCNKIFALKQTYDTHLSAKCLKISETERRKLLVSKSLHNSAAIGNIIDSNNVSNNIFNNTKIISSSTSSSLIDNQIPHSGVKLSPNKIKRCNHCKLLIPIKIYVKHLATHIKKKKNNTNNNDVDLIFLNNSNKSIVNRSKKMISDGQVFNINEKNITKRNG